MCQAEKLIQIHAEWRVGVHRVQLCAQLSRAVRCIDGLQVLAGQDILRLIQKRESCLEPGRIGGHVIDLAAQKEHGLPRNQQGLKKLGLESAVLHGAKKCDVLRQWRRVRWRTAEHCQTQGREGPANP